MRLFFSPSFSSRGDSAYLNSRGRHNSEGSGSESGGGCSSTASSSAGSTSGDTGSTAGDSTELNLLEEEDHEENNSNQTPLIVEGINYHTRQTYTGKHREE